MVSLDLEFAPIRDHALYLLSKAPNLKSLGLGGCLSLTKEGLEKFLCEDGEGRCPVGIAELDLRWGMDVVVEWIDRWLALRQRYAGLNAERGEVKGKVDLRWCDRVTLIGVEQLRRKWSGVEITFTKAKRGG